jgi:ABC-type dipeptide/oligopeptide/nickel transport system permease component
MKRWWIRPLVRVAAAIALPAFVPLAIALLIWALPGDPAAILCPPELCGGTDELAARWRLDRGPVAFFVAWLGDAIQGEFGRSWRVQQGVPVGELLAGAVSHTLLLVGIAGCLLLAGSLLAALGSVGPRARLALSALGLVPIVVWALVAAALVELRFGALSFGTQGAWIRLLAGAAALGIADGALAAAVNGTFQLFAKERNERYVRVAVLRGEGELANALPNVAGALAGQLRARFLHLLSGAVVVEVILRIDGVGGLLWVGTLLQDFGVVLAAATVFALISGALLLAQAAIELTVGVLARSAPALAPIGSGA